MTFKAILLATALVAASASGALATNQNQYSPAVSGLEPGYSWKFIGCRTTNSDLIGACQNAFNEEFTTSHTLAEYKGRQPSYATCDDPTPYASWCATFNPVVSDPRCVRSCSNNGAYLLVGRYGDNQLACLGSDSSTCTWFADANCQVLQPLAKPVTTVATKVACDAGATSGWCGEAAAIFAGGAQPECSGTTTPVTPPPVVDVNTCKAPTGGPDYGGSAWKCVQDISGADSWVPVKLTAWSQASCMSYDSRNCIWAPKECCESIAASGDNSSPYFECGPIHASVWGTTGYEDPNSWCNRAMAAIGGTVPPPPPPPPQQTNNNLQGCTRYIESGCVGGRYSNQLISALEVCKEATGSTTAYVSHAFLGTDDCGAYGSRLGVNCVFTDSSCPTTTQPVTVDTVRAPAGDSGCQLAGSPNSLPNIATACSAACALGTAGRGFSNYECRGEELYCSCASF